MRFGEPKAGVPLRRTEVVTGSGRLAGKRWMSGLDVGQLLDPAGLHLRGRRLSVGQRTAWF
jgi:hypothetical protein